MKKLLTLCLVFLSSIAYTQEFSFENILDKNLNKTLNVKGHVTITPTQILITTHNGTKELNILGCIPYYIQKKTIYRCSDENQNTIRILWIWTEQEKAYTDMELITNNKNFVFNLTKKT